MKNILLILVGGTICTSLNEDGTLSVDPKAGVSLKKNFQNSDSPYTHAVNIDLSENLLILSENMTVEKWNLILDTYRKHISGKKYDGVIFAHGTDTLAYSTALFSMILSGTDIPVFFVSANERLDSSRSNGNANFRSAVECICRGITPNVYAVYKNLSDGQMYIHLASRLEQCRNYSEDFFSVGAINITDISEENYKNYFCEIESRCPKSGVKSMIDPMGDWHLSECVLLLLPYVGMNYSAYDYSKFSAVLHGTYHSGTACAEKNKYYENYGKNSILSMIDSCASCETSVDAYFSPSRLSGEIYETVSTIGRHVAKNDMVIKFLYGYTMETAYAKLLLAYSVFNDKKSRDEFIDTECNFEIIAE